MKFIRIENLASITIIRISRPEVLNALSTEVLAELRTAFEEALANKEISGVIITGDGEKAFVAGADIKEIASLDKANASNLSRAGQELFKAIENSPKPVVGVINGFALGGGCELAMACHMRIATENAKFGQPEVNLGIIPGYGGTQRLPQLVGRAKALELMLTGDAISAADALRIGLVNHVAPGKSEAMELATGILKKIGSKGPYAVAQIVKSVNAGYGFENAGYKTEAEAFGDCTVTEDFKEGTRAFLEKRPPQFKGK